jgi:hypothetical protein
LLYTGQSRRLFELKPDMTWPDRSWVFSRFLGNEMAQLVVSVLLVLVTLGFIASGLGLFIKQDWWRLAAAGSAVLSTAVFVLSWNGEFQALDDQGGIGILINLAILGIVLFVQIGQVVQ